MNYFDTTGSDPFAGMDFAEGPASPAAQSEPPAEAVDPAAVMAGLKRRRLERGWKTATATVEKWIEDAGSRYARMTARTPDARPRVIAGLAPLLMFAEESLGNSRRSTVLGLSNTVEADLANREVVAEDGEVAKDSTLYRLLDYLGDCTVAGVPEPEAAFRYFLEASNLPALWSMLRVLGGGRAPGWAPNGDSEHSCLNFEVPRVEASNRSLDEVLAQLDELVGLEPVKTVLREFAAVEQMAAMRREAGLRTTGQSRHMLFLGNPGTGKTTVARLVSEVLKACGSLPQASLVEADRAMLVGEFLGTSALKTRKVADAALGGVLFIDEAYALAAPSDAGAADRFAQEALDTLVKVMEDDREDLVVILAGYPEQMARLLAMNPGLASRIGITVVFPDFGTEHLLSIFADMAAAVDYELGEGALEPMRMAFEMASRGPRFGNARLARVLLEAAIRAHATRLTHAIAGGETPDVSELMTLRFADTQMAARVVPARSDEEGSPS